MRASLGKVSAVLAESTESVITNELIRLINSNVNPPEEVTAENVYIRAMFVVSDEVNSFGGRFPIEEQEQLTKLIVDSPVMVGHRKDKLPIGRTFHATITERNGGRWVKSYFYWLKSADGAETLRENVDGGIYKECSIGFTFMVPECSICGKDIRICEHEPLVNYTENEDEVSCYYNYREIERVLETSLVYRGAVSDTAISKELKAVSTKLVTGTNPVFEAVRIDNLAQLDQGEQYIVTPLYEGLPVRVSTEHGSLSLRQIDGSRLSEAITERFASVDLSEDREFFGCIVGFRGKERCSSRDVVNFIQTASSPVSRLELHLLNCKQGTRLEFVEQPGRFRVRQLRHRIVSSDKLPDAVRRMQTRDRVRIWLNSTPPPEHSGYQYKAGMSDSLAEGQYGLLTHCERTDAMFIVRSNGSLNRFRICQFSMARLYKGMRFLVDEVSLEPVTKGSESHVGRIISSESKDGGMKFSLKGKLNGKFIIRPVKLDGEKRYLFYSIGR